MANDTQLEELAKAYDALPTCGSHTQYDYSCKDCVKLAHPDSQTVEEWAGLPTEADWQQWEQEQAETSERLTLKADAFDEAMSIPDSPRQWWTPFTEFEKPVQPPTPFFSRSDGKPLLYERALGWLYGPSGWGKSWVSLMACREALDAGYHVAYVDYELGTDDFKERALMLGLYQYLKPDPARLGLLRHVPGYQLELGDRSEIAEWASGDDGEGLIIIDSAGSSGCPDDGPKGVPEWLAEHIRPYQLLPDSKRPAILVVDHVSKNPNGRMPGPIGAQAKMREVTGIAMRTTGNPWTRTEAGTLTLVCEKDRRGYWKRGTPMATITGTWTDGAFGYQITEPEQPAEPAAAVDLRQAVENAIYDSLDEAHKPPSFTALKKAARQKTRFANNTALRVFLGWMVA